MDIKEFEATLHREHFDEVRMGGLTERDNTEHTHPFEVRAFVTAGAITLTVEGEARTYREGDIFSLPLDCRHKETVGPEGVKYLLGKKNAT